MGVYGLTPGPHLTFLCWFLLQMLGYNLLDLTAVRLDCRPQVVFVF